MIDDRSADGRTNPLSAAALRRRSSAGAAELAAIGTDRSPSLVGRLLGPLAAAAVTIAVYGLLATSLATRLVTRREPGPS